MNKEQLFKILTSIPHNKHYITKYLNFITNIKENSPNIKTQNEAYCERHHVLPKSLFPEFENFSLHVWNKIRLTGRQHFIAHLMLAKAFGGKTWSCIYFVANNSNIYLQSKKYELVRIQISKALSILSKK